MIWGRLKGLLGAKPAAWVEQPAAGSPPACQLPEAASGSPRQPRPGFGAADSAADWLRRSGVIARAVQAGEMIPDFELCDQAGVAVGLQALLDRGPLVITFTLGVDSARCCASLLALQESLPAITAAGAALVAVSPDRRDRSRALAQASGIAYPLLEDTQEHTAGLFGLLYAPPEPTDLWFERIGVGSAGRKALVHAAPLPATYVVDTASIAVFVFLDPDPTHRVDPADVLTVLRYR